MASRVLVVASPITVAPEVIPAWHTVERIFKDVGVFGGGFKDFHPEQEAVGSRFGTGKHLSGRMRSTIPLNSGWAL